MGVMPLVSPRPVRSRHGRQTLVDERGVALVEFALVLPLLLLIVLGIVDFGKAFGYKNQETHLANEAARYAAVNRCAACDSAGQTINQFVRAEADPKELRDNLNMTIAFADSTGKFPDEPGYNGGSLGTKNHCTGAAVKVKMEYTYKFFGFLNLIPVTVGGSSVMRLERHWSGNPTTGIHSASDKYDVTMNSASADSCT
jgi:Flp pilus assembly protein TadG